MKVIDLLVKIANGEEVPKKIIYKDRVREFDYEDKDYTYISDTDYYLFHDILVEGTGDKMVTGLNDEIEIIEDTPKKIEHIHLANIPEERRWFTFRDKINEIIDKINEDSNERNN